MKAHGYTIRTNWGSDRPDYEADLLVCAHCGKTVFMCDSVTKKPLPASVVAERCGSCNRSICGWCKNEMRGAGACRNYVDRLYADEHAFAEIMRTGSWT